jgi:hypothetical protein
MTQYHVAGFYAGDGVDVRDHPVGTTGSTWKARFAAFGPNAASGSGIWTYTAILSQGADVNIDAPMPLTGTPVWPPSGSGLGSGTFKIVNPSAIEPPFLRYGFLRANGVDPYFQHDSSEEQYFLKTGSGGPENFLAYYEFTGTANHGVGQCGCSDCTGNTQTPIGGHVYNNHFPDWTSGDPTWAGIGVEKGKNIIGALNYLSSLDINSIFFMPMNLAGDGRDVFPFVTLGTNMCTPVPADLVFHYSVPRMAEWNLVFEHAMRKSILLEFVLAEREIGNIDWLGGSADTGGVALSRERKLYLKQMVAMFGHNPAVKWNLCEENDLISAGTTGGQFDEVELEALANWIRSWDIYEHPIGVHTVANSIQQYRVMLDQNRATWLDVTSLQVHGENNNNNPPGATESTFYGYAPQQARILVETHPNSTHAVVVDVDENGSGGRGAAPEAVAMQFPSWEADATDRRRRILYDVLFAGANLSWYYGYHDVSVGGGDISLEDFSTRTDLFRYTKFARQIMLYPDVGGSTATFVGMHAWDDLVSGCSGLPPGADLLTAPVMGGGFGSGSQGLDMGACSGEFGRPRVFAKENVRILVHYPDITQGFGTIDLSFGGPPSADFSASSVWFDPRDGSFVPPRTLIQTNFSLHTPPAPQWPTTATPSDDLVYFIEVHQ